MIAKKKTEYYSADPGESAKWRFKRNQRINGSVHTGRSLHHRLVLSSYRACVTPGVPLTIAGEMRGLTWASSPVVSCLLATFLHGQVRM